MQVRLEYGVGDELRFLSHLDFLRLFIRAFRRAKLPIAYSQGFNPHPKMSFGPPLAVGITSSREYFDFELENPLPLLEIVKSLQKGLPKGLEISGAQEIKNKVPSLMAIIERASYEIKIVSEKGLTEAEWKGYINALFNRKEIHITRRTKEGPRSKEIRQGIFEIDIRQAQDGLVFIMVLQNGNQGAVRPEEVINALIEQEGAPLCTGILKIHRTGLYAVKENALLTPLEVLSN